MASGIGKVQQRIEMYEALIKGEQNTSNGHTNGIRRSYSTSDLSSMPPTSKPILKREEPIRVRSNTEKVFAKVSPQMSPGIGRKKIESLTGRSRSSSLKKKFIQMFNKKPETFQGNSISLSPSFEKKRAPTKQAKEELEKKIVTSMAQSDKAHLMIQNVQAHLVTLSKTTDPEGLFLISNLLSRQASRVMSEMKNTFNDYQQVLCAYFPEYKKCVIEQEGHLTDLENTIRNCLAKMQVLLDALNKKDTSLEIDGKPHPKAKEQMVTKLSDFFDIINKTRLENKLSTLKKEIHSDVNATKETCDEIQNYLSAVKDLTMVYLKNIGYSLQIEVKRKNRAYKVFFTDLAYRETREIEVTDCLKVIYEQFLRYGPTLEKLTEISIKIFELRRDNKMLCSIEEQVWKQFEELRDNIITMQKIMNERNTVEEIYKGT